jgi:two-component system, cell cycle response regulator DivK
MPEDFDNAAVLLVELSPDERDMYAIAIRGAGLRPIVGADGVAALDDALGVDVIVAGDRFPGSIGGFNLVQRLRQDERTNSKPVILLTSSALALTRQQALSAGCDAVLVKPCAPEMLIREIRSLMEQSRALLERSGRNVDRGKALQARAQSLRARSRALLGDPTDEDASGKLSEP